MTPDPMSESPDAGTPRISNRSLEAIRYRVGQSIWADGEAAKQDVRTLLALLDRADETLTAVMDQTHLPSFPDGERPRYPCRCAVHDDARQALAAYLAADPRPAEAER